MSIAGASPPRETAPARPGASTSQSMAACVVLAVLIAAAAAAPRGAMAQFCFINGDAGTQQDASACVDYLRAKGSTPCCHTGSVEGGCTTMAFAGTTRVDICGEPGTCTACDYAGDTLNVVLAKCVATVDGTNRVAGYITSKTGEFLFVMQSNA